MGTVINSREAQETRGEDEGPCTDRHCVVAGTLLCTIVIRFN